MFQTSEVCCKVHSEIEGGLYTKFLVCEFHDDVLNFATNFWNSEQSLEHCSEKLVEMDCKLLGQGWKQYTQSMSVCRLVVVVGLRLLHWAL